MSEETIFSEVDEELRRDRMRNAWRRYGPWVIAAAVAVVLLVAANEGWAWLQNGNAARSSDQFYAALDLENGGDVAGAQKALDKLIAEGTGSYPALAKFKEAGLLAKQGKNDEALAAYDQLSTSQGNQHLKELALLLGANLLVDKGDLPGVKSRVEGLLSPDDPLHNSARETVGLTQYKTGDLNGARDSFEAVIGDPLTSDDVRGRMQLFIAQLVAQGATPPPAAAAEVNAATPADAAAAAVSAINATKAAGGSDATPAATGTPSTSPTPAAANDNTAAPATDDTTPVGVESSQPSVPDSALDLATPAPSVPAAVPTSDAVQPTLSNGIGLPAPADASAPPAPATGDATSTAPLAAAPAAAPANDASQPAPAGGTSGQ